MVGFFVPFGVVVVMVAGGVWALVMATLVVYAVIRRVRTVRANRRGSAPRCSTCRYSLESCRSDRCPECGANLRRAHAVLMDGAPAPFSWRWRIVVMLLVAVYPLLGAAVVIDSTQALQAWFGGQASKSYSSPSSGLYAGVEIEEEWVTVFGWSRGVAKVHLVPGGGMANSTEPLTVLTPRLHASYLPPGHIGPRVSGQLDADFVLEWMKSQGVNVDAPMPPVKSQRRHLPPEPGIRGEAEAICVALKGRAGTLPPTADDASRLVGGPAFFGTSSGVRPGAVWRLWWYWPVVIPLLGATLVSLAFLVRPKRRSGLLYPSRA